MSDVPRTGAPAVPARARRASVAAIVVLGFAWAFVMQSLGWAQTSYFALVKSLSDGTAQIDRYHWETRDKSWTGGHFYSVKAPGLPMLLVPVYEGLRAVGVPALARGMAENARASGARQWTYRGLNVSAYGFDPERAARVKRLLEDQAPLIWALGLFGSVIPAVLLLLAVRGLADRLRPGTGGLAALSLGTATLVMVFAAQLFGHVLAALLAFGAFALLWREREGPERRGLVALAGLLAGLAVLTEYPLALAGAICGGYALARPGAAGSVRGLVRRAWPYAAGVVAGVLPLLVYNRWAFGAVGTMSYDNAVDRQGFTGHDTLGLNSGGFFGITMPDGRVALELLVSPRGLVALTPVVALALYGVVLMHRRGRRAEAWTIAAIALAFFVYDTGYWLPFGGGSPGPRFLVPILPFLAVGLAETWRRLPATTLALSAVGAVVMIVGLITYPLIGTGSLWQWWARMRNDEFQHTLLTVLGAGNGWGPILPLLLALLAAWVLALRGAGPLGIARDLPVALGALAAWGLLALVVAPAVGEVKIVGVGRTAEGAVDHTGLPWQVVALALGAALLALGVAWWAEARARRRPADAGSAAQVVDDEGAPALAAHPQPGR